MSDARRAAGAIGDVERAAYKLARALTATGDAMFHRVNPAAVRAANEWLLMGKTGLRLVSDDE